MKELQHKVYIRTNSIAYRHFFIKERVPAETGVLYVGSYRTKWSCCLTYGTSTSASMNNLDRTTNSKFTWAGVALTNAATSELIASTPCGGGGDLFSLYEQVSLVYYCLACILQQPQV